MSHLYDVLPRELTDQFWPLQVYGFGTGRHWRPDNPAAGQCGVTALVVNDELGGEILKTDVNGFWHFYNSVAGRRVDFTMSQFSSPIFYDNIPSSRSEALLDCSQQQYELLRARVHA